jgi:hypothetical protein
VRILVGEQHNRGHKANRHASGDEKQNFAEFIFRLENFPAIHPQPPRANWRTAMRQRGSREFCRRVEIYREDAPRLVL